MPVLQATPGLGFTQAMTATLFSAGAVAQVAGKMLGGAIIAKIGNARSFTYSLALQASHGPQSH
jgi:hypothetical protein